jgi:hypothetical protein
MPTNPKLTSLLALLKNGTEARRLQWQTTPDENTFRVSLANGLVRLSRNESEALTPVPVTYTLSVLDDRGQLIDDYTPESEQEKASLAELFGVVRRSTLNLEHILDSMLNELKARVG